MARKRKTESSPPPPVSVFTPVIPEPVSLPREVVSGHDAEQLRMLIMESNRRKCEALKLYEALDNSKPFHQNRKRMRLLIGSNQAGKTIAACAEFARVVTGQDPFNKYPKTDGKAFVFGLTGKHLGDPIYEKCFRAGAFKVIRDSSTGLWRAYHGVFDAHRAHEAKPAPPLIPRRFIRSISWDKKKERIPSMITFTTGWEAYFFSSLAAMPQGQSIDYWWIDEEPGREHLISELRPRCVARGGKGVWSATPQVASTQLFDLHDRAPDADTEEFHLHIKDNPHIAQEEKDALFRGLTPEEREVRWEGRFLFSSFLVYPEFSKVVHAWPNSQGWQVPADWTCYFSVDPGTQVCAIIFMAVPPPHVGRFTVIYDELYIERCDADKFGKMVGAKSTGKVYEFATIDSKASRVHDMGSGLQVEDQYRAALIKYGVQMRNGVGFKWGSTDEPAGRNSVHDYLRVTGSGKPGMYVVIERCPNLVREIERYRFMMDPQTRMPTDRPVKKMDHLVDSLRYLCHAKPYWRKNKPFQKKDSLAYQAFIRDKNRKRRDGAPSVSLGMGTQPGE